MSCQALLLLFFNYNYVRFLGAAIDSAVNQDHPNCEVIVVDDGSTDNSRDVIAQYATESDLCSARRMTVRSLH
jgi:glycosyltransferase involved in cell wall biosynthesis